jgi:hypothetical protein
VASLKSPQTHDNSVAGLSALLESLRRPGDEAQLTQVIKVVAERDPAFAAGFAKTVVSGVPRASARKTLGSVPDRLQCTAEVHLDNLAGEDKGFVDLKFEDADAGFLLLVELKLYSGYGFEQLQRYLDGLKAQTSPRSALAAITRDVPRYGEWEAHADQQWLGSIRWARIFERLRALKHLDADLARAWPAFLDALKEKGDFGTMDIDPALIEGWARYQEGQDLLIGVMNEIAAPALDIVQSTYAATSGLSVDDAAEIVMHKNRVVWPWKERINVQFAVPKVANAERLRIQFLGGMGEPYFTVEARHEDVRPLLKAGAEPLTGITKALEEQGFATGHSWGNYWARVHGPDEWLVTDGSMQEKLLALVEADVQDLVSSGLFEALPPASDGGPARPGEEPPSDADEPE